MKIAMIGTVYVGLLSGVRSSGFGHGQPITMFRFSTVRGPCRRTDMALFKFTKAILAGKPIDGYNHIKTWRDFTCVTDLVRGIRLLIDLVAGGPETAVVGDSMLPEEPFRLDSIGNSEKVRLEAFIEGIETATGHKTTRNDIDMQPGDVLTAWVDCSLIMRLTGYEPQTDLRYGITRFGAWCLKKPDADAA